MFYQSVVWALVFLLNSLLNLCVLVMSSGSGILYLDEPLKKLPLPTAPSLGARLHFTKSHAQTPVFTGEQQRSAEFSKTQNSVWFGIVVWLQMCGCVGRGVIFSSRSNSSEKAWAFQTESAARWVAQCFNMRLNLWPWWVYAEPTQSRRMGTFSSGFFYIHC